MPLIFEMIFVTNIFVTFRGSLLFFRDQNLTEVKRRLDGHNVAQTQTAKSACHDVAVACCAQEFKPSLLMGYHLRRLLETTVSNPSSSMIGC